MDTSGEAFSRGLGVAMTIEANSDTRGLEARWGEANTRLNNAMYVCMYVLSSDEIIKV